MRTVTVISKSGCHLCERVVLTLRRLAPSHDVRVEVLDIDSDPELRRKYWLEVPVVRVQGEDVFDARDMTADSGYVEKLERLVVS